MPTPLQKFLIAPLKSGYQTNVKPWLIADDAYAILRNAYTWRGRVKKRIGGRVLNQGVPPAVQQQFTRFRVQVGTLDGFGDLTAFVPRTGIVPNVTPAIGQMFSIGDDFYTVNALGNPALLLKSNPLTTTATFDTTTGQFVFVNASPTAHYTL